MEIDIRPGDVVILKSGSPTMTVDEVDNNYGTVTAWCSWFNGKAVVRDSFPISSLKKSPG